MKVQNMTSQDMTTAINEARNRFKFYGFTTSPLTRREIAKLIIRGRTAAMFKQSWTGKPLTRAARNRLLNFGAGASASKKSG